MEYLRMGYRITPLEALTSFQSMRLGAVIFSLKKKGHVIESKMVTVPSGKHVKQYWLVRRERQLELC